MGLYIKESPDTSVSIFTVMPQEQLQHLRPLWLGVLAAAFTPALCLFALWLTPVWPDRKTMDALHTFIFFLVVSVPVALLALLALGLPFVLWLRSKRLLAAQSTCAASTLIGVLVFGTFASVVALDHSSPSLLQLLSGACLGLASGATFCIAAGITIRPSGRRTGAA